MNFELSAAGQKYVKEQMQRFETKRSAIIPSLYRVQEENHGWVSPACVEYLGKFMDLPVAWVEEVLGFYTMLNQKRVGRQHVQVCCNVSCCMLGARELVKELCEEYGVEPEAVSSDGKVTVSKVECLGSCDTAPMAQNWT